MGDIKQPGFFRRVYDAALGKTKQYDPRPNVELSYANVNGLFFGTDKLPVTVYNPSKLYTEKGPYVVDDMRRDAQVKVALNFKKHAILGTGWRIESPEGEKDDWPVKEFVEEELFGLAGTFDRTLRNILSAVDYGFSATERVWHKRSDGMLGYKSLKTRLPHDFQFDIDPHGNVVKLRQLGLELPPEKFILYAFADEFGNPFGTSELEAAYDPWWVKKNAYKFLGILLERLGVPPVFATYNQNSFTSVKDQEKIQAIISKLQAGSSAAFPRGENKDDINFWAPEIAGQASTVFVPALQHCDFDIAKAILLPGLIGGTADQTQGSLARSKTHFDSFMLVTESLRQEVRETIVQEQIIKPLVDINFPNTAIEEYPRFVFNPLESKDINLLMATWATLVNDGVVSKQEEDEAFIREQLEFPPISDEEAAATIITRSEPPPQSPTPPVPPSGGAVPSDRAPGMHPAAPPPNPSPKRATPGRVDPLEPISSYSLSRQPNKYEQQVDFAAIQSKLDKIEGEGIKRFAEAYIESRNTMLRFIRANYDRLGPKIADQLSIRNKQSIQNVIQEMLRNAFDAGRADVKSEMPKHFAKPISGFAPNEAINYLKQKAITAAATANDKVLSDAKQSLLTSMKGQKTVGEAMAALSKVFEPYTGNLGGPYTNNSPLYAQVVARTNTIDAYNQGRLTSIRDPEVADYVAGVEYSAILDSRTTELCRSLDGKVFEVGDPDLDRLTPPNHYNCRSVLVPVMIDESPTFISNKEKGAALDKAGAFA